jgi:3'(2'),5'-bisphosphate nucleotidase
MVYAPTTDQLLQHPDAMMNIMRRAALAAGAAIMEHYDESGFQGDVKLKNDESPVTIADIAADEIIRAALAADFPGIPVVTEETVQDADHDHLGSTRHYFLVDPLDGTKSFRKGSPDFTVNIALIEKSEPKVGVVYLPAFSEGYAGHTFGEGTALRWHDDRTDDAAIMVRDIPPNGVTLLTSTSQHDHGPMADLIASVKMARHLKRNSSLKFCEIAAGRADIYPRFKGINYWDTAAADAVLRAAGGFVVDFNGTPLLYDRSRKQFDLPGFVAGNDLDYLLPILIEMRSAGQI